MNHREQQLRAYYQTLFGAWGCQHWWPAGSRFEVIVGAYLTQNTSWTNVEAALRNLRSARVLSLGGIRRVKISELQALIRPSGYFRQKAQRLKTFVAFLDRRYDGSLAKLFAKPTAQLREELLNLNGVGPETADSILLYAGNHPVFVVDAYTRRILERHGIVGEKAPYEEIQQLFEDALQPLGSNGTKAGSPTHPAVALTIRGNPHAPSRMSAARRSPTAQIYNDMHGLIVEVGKHFCRKSQAKCDECPLRPFLPSY